MALQIADVYAKLGYREDTSGATRWERRLQGLRGKAHQPIETHARLDVDQTGFHRYDRAVDRAEKSSGRFHAGVVGKFGAARMYMGGAAVAMGASAGLIGKSVLGMASDIEESLAKNEQLFGKHAAGVDRWSQNTAKSLGIARGTALEAAGTFGNLFTALEIGPEKSAKMSTSLVQLAADLASFNNATPEEAIEAIRSGLVGETEPLRRFGVNMNDATLKAEALKMGLIKTTKEALEPQDKALAANALIFKQTEKAHGDFARTSDGLANQQRILKARLSDTGAELGAKLLPFALKVAHGLNRMLDQAQRGEGIFGTLARVGRGAGEAIGDVGRFVSRAFNAVRDAFSGGNKDATAYAGNVREMVTMVIGFVRRLWNSVSRIFGDMGGDLRTIGGAWMKVERVITDAMIPVIRRVLPGLRDAIEGIATVVRGVVRVIAGLLKGDFGQAWRGAKEIVSGAIRAIQGVLRAATGPIREAFVRVASVAVGAFEKVFGGVPKIAANVVNAIIGVLNKLPGVNIGRVSWGGPSLPRGGSSGGRGGPQGTGRTSQNLYGGGKVTAPIAIMGEEAPAHPEWVIPTNPAYRGRAVGLWMAAARELGIPGFALGGVVDFAKSLPGRAARSVGGLKDWLVDQLPKIPGGPLSGALEWGKDRAVDFIGDKVGSVFKSVTSALAPPSAAGGGGGSATGLVPAVLRAIAFARAHGWGGGIISGWRSRAEQAILYARYLAGTGNKAAPPGSSNHEGGEAVDVSDTEAFARAMAQMGAGQLYRRVSGEPWHFSVTGYAKGGKHGKRRAPKPMLSKPDQTGITRSLRRGDRGIPVFENQIQELERAYGQTDRRYGLSDEELVIEHDDGSAERNEPAIAKRLEELRALEKRRKAIGRVIKRYRDRVEAMIARYQAAVQTLTNAMSAARGKARKKERAGYRQKIRDYRARIAELRGVGRDLSGDAVDTTIDLEELAGEIGAVSGTAGRAATDDGAGAGTDADAGTAGGDTAAAAAPDETAQAIADQATARATALEQDLAAANASLAAFGSPGDIGAYVGGGTAFGAATAGFGYGPGSAPAAAPSGGPYGGPAVVVEYRGVFPPTGRDLELVGGTVARAFDAMPTRPATSERAGG